MILNSKPVFMVFFLICSMMVSMPMYPSRVDPPLELWEPPWPWPPLCAAGWLPPWPTPWLMPWPTPWVAPWLGPWLPMGTGMPLAEGADMPPPPTPSPCGGKGLEGEGAPTFGGLAGTAGLGLTSGGTMSDMSIKREGRKLTKLLRSRPLELFLSPKNHSFVGVVNTWF